MSRFSDLTRWNRAGLSELKYVDGNAVTFLEQLRLELEKRFPEETSSAWEAVNVSVAEDETVKQKHDRITAQYLNKTSDPAWEILRAFARAGHVLTETINAYTNEAYIGTATQWENIRRMVNMLDYHPTPPASATTSVGLFAKDGTQGTAEAGLLMKMSPEDGSAPVKFETIEDLDVDSRINELRPQFYNRNQQSLASNTLLLEGEVKKLNIGEPLILESEQTGKAIAYLIKGVQYEVDPESEDDSILYTSVSVSPKIDSDFISGYTKVHTQPKEKLNPVGPMANGTLIDKALHLKNEPKGLSPGDVVYIQGGRKYYYRFVSSVKEKQLVLYHNLGYLGLKDATVSKPIKITVKDWEKLTGESSDNDKYYSCYAAGDWTYLINTNIAHYKRGKSGTQYLPVYFVREAEYISPEADSENPGYTRFRLRWLKSRDGVDDDKALAEQQDFELDQPYFFMVPAQGSGQWEVDTYLEKRGDGKFATIMQSDLPKKTSVGDFAALNIGKQFAWAKLASITLDEDNEVAYLSADGNGWQDRGGGLYYQSESKIFSHFVETVRAYEWQTNDTPLTGNYLYLDDFDLDASEEVPVLLAKHRKVMLHNSDVQSNSLLTSISEVDQTNSRVKLTFEDELPTSSTTSNLIIHANVVTASHGESKPTKVLGSGDATLSHQSFLLEISDISFIPDASASSGVKADIAVSVSGKKWEQVATLNDSSSTDEHFEVRVTEDNFLRIRFGDGSHGRRLPTGSNNVRIVYRQGSGTRGNIAAGSFSKPATKHLLVDSINQILPAAGGSEMEDIGSLKENAPPATLALQRAVSLNDFAHLARSHSSIWQASAFSIAGVNSRRRLIEVVVVAADNADVSLIKSDIESYLTEHALPNTQVLVSSYESIEVQLEITLRVDLAAYEEEAVENAVKAALVDTFSLEKRKLGQSLYRGDLYYTVEAIEGVENSTCEIKEVISDGASQSPMLVKGDDEIIKTIKPYPRQVIHLNEDTPVIDIIIEAYED